MVPGGCVHGPREGGGGSQEGCMVLGSAWSRGGMVPSGCMVWGCLVETPPTATAVGGTHPTGMHSCFQSVCLYYSDSSSDKDQRKKSLSVSL